MTIIFDRNSDIIRLEHPAYKNTFEFGITKNIIHYQKVITEIINLISTDRESINVRIEVIDEDIRTAIEEW